MTELDPQPSHGDANDAERLRADTAATRARILEAAATMALDRRTSMAEIAAAAGVGRSTLYRHFPSRQALRQATQAHESRAAPSEAVSPLPFQAPGRLGRDRPLPLEVTHILEQVPPHLVPDQLVAEARREAGVPVALYVIDIDGSRLIRLAGSEEFPRELDAPPALGPEIVPEGLPGYEARLRERFAGCVAEPLWLRGRVLGLLLCVGAPVAPLEDVAKQGAAALELAGGYTDFIDAARRWKPTTPAAEIQQNLFPPRIARISGAQLAGGLLPTYEVGGDWFDFVENRDGAWLAIADAAGTGPTAAGLGAAALGSLRAARRSGRNLLEALRLMDETVRGLGNPEFFVTALVARWRAATGELTWVNCGQPNAFVVDQASELSELEGPVHRPLGEGARPRTFAETTRTLASGERLVLVTDGITARKVEGGGRFGAAGIHEALEPLGDATAASSAMAILQAVSDCSREPLEDDATVVVLRVD